MGGFHPKNKATNTVISAVRMHHAMKGLDIIKSINQMQCLENMQLCSIEQLKSREKLNKELRWESISECGDFKSINHCQ